MELTASEKIDIWKRAIETQIHFAELSIKMRQIGITLAGATIALAVVMYRTSTEYSIPLPLCDLVLPIGSALSLAAAFILYAAKLIDVGVYHEMLRGAVKFNELYEARLDGVVGWDAGLTETITAFSRYKKPELAATRGGNGRHWSEGEARGAAGNRIKAFYWLGIAALIAVAVLLMLAEN